jgi:hypothetical protein
MTDCAICIKANTYEICLACPECCMRAIDRAKNVGIRQGRGVYAALSRSWAKLGHWQTKNIVDEKLKRGG